MVLLSGGRWCPQSTASYRITSFYTIKRGTAIGNTPTDYINSQTPKYHMFIHFTIYPYVGIIQIRLQVETLSFLSADNISSLFLDDYKSSCCPVQARLFLNCYYYLNFSSTSGNTRACSYAFRYSLGDILYLSLNTLLNVLWLSNPLSIQIFVIESLVFSKRWHA